MQKNLIVDHLLQNRFFGAFFSRTSLDGCFYKIKDDLIVTDV